MGFTFFRVSLKQRRVFCRQHYRNPTRLLSTGEPSGKVCMGIIELHENRLPNQGNGAEVMRNVQCLYLFRI
jgi:hypothetical protein